MNLKLPDHASPVFQRDGVICVPGVATSEEVASITRQVPTDVAGQRNILHLDVIAALARDERMETLIKALSPEPLRPVRGLFFDKNPSANWAVAWHQDVAVALKEKVEAPGFGPWSVKAGIPHAHAPAELLARMITVRLHLDDCGLENGPLRVIPGSHKEGRLGEESTARWTSRQALECVVDAGDIVVMAPLLLHASLPARQPFHRRVLHLEFGPVSLPCGLRWAF